MELRLDGIGGRIIDFGANGFKSLVCAQIELTPQQASEKEAAGDPLPVPLPFPWQCLIDTGAQRTHVKMDVVKRLQMEPIGATGVRDFDGNVLPDAPVYRVNFRFTNPPDEPPASGPWYPVDVVAGAAPKIPHDVVLGMDILTRCTMVFDGPAMGFSIKMSSAPQAGSD